MPTATRLLAILLPALLLGVLAGAPAANAGTPDFVVNSTADEVDADIGDNICATAENDCTLRAAIQESNFLGGAQTIIVPAGTYELTRTLIQGGGGPVDDDSNSDLDIRDAVTITGAGSGLAIIDGLNQHRIFDVTQTFDSTVNISGLTLQNGNSSNANGGGIQFRGFGVTAYLADIVIADSVGQYGGGIYVETNTNLTIDDSRIEDNTAVSDGGGIDINTTGVVTVTDTTIEGNEADSGAGIMNTDISDGNLYIENSVISNNIAATFGGGVFNGAYASITDTTIDGNDAVLNGGGGIYDASSTELSIERSTISNNHAGGENEGGGGIQQDSTGEINIFNSTIANNTSDTVGGAMLIQGDGGTFIQATTVAGNRGDGGIYFRVAGPLTISNAILQDNGAKNCKREAGVGGSIVGGGPYLADDSSCNSSDLTVGSAGLQPLADNGGPTRTMAILAGSPAIDAGDFAHCPGTDQRGAHRLDGDGFNGAQCDLGAYEFGYLTVLAGDLNCDGQLDALDVLPALYVLAELEPEPAPPCPAPGTNLTTSGGSPSFWGNLNCDNAFAENDIETLLTALAGVPQDPDDDCDDVGTTTMVAINAV